MNRVIVAMIVGTFAFAGASVHAADTATQKDSKTVKAMGGPCTPGAGDSSAAVKNKPQGGDVKCDPAASAKEPGRSGDPASARASKNIAPNL